MRVLVSSPSGRVAGVSSEEDVAGGEVGAAEVGEGQDVFAVEGEPQVAPAVSEASAFTLTKLPKSKSRKSRRSSPLLMPRSGVLHLAWTCLMLLSAVLVGAVATSGQAQAGAQREAIVLELDGAIGPAVADYVRRGIGMAAQRNAALVILRMDTPGGLDAAMRDIVREILASPVPVATFVGPNGARAASAGTFILYASHLAVMAPSTNVGAATPVQIGGESPARTPGPNDGDATGKGGQKSATDPRNNKAVNDAAGYIRGLAELRGRSAEWAESAVRKAASLTASAALERGVIDFIAEDISRLLAKAHGREVRLGQSLARLDTAGLKVLPVEPGWRTRLLATITNPSIAYILLLVGVYGLIVEFANPGAILPGVVGGISLIVGLFALNFLPVNYAGLALIALGMGLMAAEAFVPSFGVLGMGGAVAFAGGSLFLFDTDVPGLTLHWPVVLIATGVSTALLVLGLAVGLRAQRRRVVTGDAGLIGTIGEVLSWSDHGGQVHVHGERWRARAASPLQPGQRVRVAGRERLTLFVEPELLRHDPSNE